TLQERPLKPTEIAVGGADDEVGIAVAVPIGDRQGSTIGNERHIEQLARSEAASADVAKEHDSPVGRAGKSLVGKPALSPQPERDEERPFAVDKEKIVAESRYDGKSVLWTNNDLVVADAALLLKPFDDTVRDQLFCSFVALLLRSELQAARGRAL